MPLKTIQKRNIYWAISFVSLLFISISSYYLLGGFDDYKVTGSSNNHYTIAGRWVSGLGVYQEEQDAFEEMGQLILDDKLQGVLCLIDFQPDSLERHEVHRFVGVLMEEDVFLIPKGLDVYEIKSETSFMVPLTMHPLVMPNTKTVQEKIFSYADSAGYHLKNFTLERFYQDESVLVEMFAK